MKFSRLLLGTSVAFGLALWAEPAAAQYNCVLTPPNPFPVAPGPQSLYCGVLSGASTGLGQTALGVSYVINGDAATAIGSNAWSSSGFIGSAGLVLPTDSGTTAVGAYSFAVGDGNVAIGDQAGVGVPGLFSGSGRQVEPINNGTAVGSHSLVTADAGTAVGEGSSVSGIGGSAFGTGAAASGEGSVAVGQFSTASDFDSVAVGFGTTASGASSVAIGDVAQATAANSVAIGSGSVADQANTVSIGTSGNERRIVNVAAGTAATDAVNVSQLTAVSAGTTANTTAITGLQTGLATTNTAVTSLQTGLAATNTAVTSLDTRVDALEAIADGLDDRLDDVEHHSDAGTATAVALSGAMFLPGKTFNLTTNVGAYRGAVAGALQIGALVSDMIAVNAGIAHGFNKGGKTALRAGFTFGW